jgi:DNA mismatch repair protein MutL
MPIRILSDEIASQIAAGEVIERPASVVKELVENALDAEASHISITVENAGKKLIEVSDNGCGIPEEELPLSVARHATSKLSTAEDLFSIRTLGFRGEALSSIGSVSKLTITSRFKDAEMGRRLIVVGGVADSPRPVGSPKGTVVKVEDLFLNLPARLKFLKTDRTERRHISDLVTRYALAYAQVRFQLTQEKRLSINTSGNGDRREVLAALYGVDNARKMVQVAFEENNLHINGFISPPNLTVSNRKDILFFINGRPVQDSALTTSLLRAYHTMLMVGRFPKAAIFVDIPPEAVDVNVHPAKAEVRFRDRDRVFRAVGRAVRRALLAHTPVPDIDLGMRWDSRQGAAQNRWEPSWNLSVDSQTIEQDETAQISTGGEQLSIPSTPDSPILRLVGQVAAAYLVAEGPDGLYLIDQHAAHERILYEQFINQREGSFPAQILLEPVTVEFSSRNANLLEEQIPYLLKIGFKVEQFGRNTFLIRAIPDLLSGMNPEVALRVLVEEFEEDESPFEREIEKKIIARVCKRAAVKAGKTLSSEEQLKLLYDLESCQSPRTCPHGRPTMIHLSVDLLERQFGRKG